MEAALDAKLVTLEELRLGIDLMPQASRDDVTRRLEGLHGKALLKRIQGDLDEDEAMRLALETQREARAEQDLTT